MAGVDYFITTNIETVVRGAQNDLQYCEDKMAIMLDIFHKMGLMLDFWRNTSTNTGCQEKLHHKLAENGKFSWLFH